MASNDKPKLLEECRAVFGTTDLYRLYQLDRAANPSKHKIKKAYKKLALKVHPDYVISSNDELIPTIKFTILSKVHCVLSHDKRRAKYDLKAVVEDEKLPQFYDWTEYWYLVFRKNARAEDFLYEELDLLKTAYYRSEGAMDGIVETVQVVMKVDIPRFRQEIEDMIACNELPKLPAFVKYCKENPLPGVPSGSNPMPPPEEDNEDYIVMEVLGKLNSDPKAKKILERQGQKEGKRVISMAEYLFKQYGCVPLPHEIDFSEFADVLPDDFYDDDSQAEGNQNSNAIPNEDKENNAEETGEQEDQEGGSEISSENSEEDEDDEEEEENPNDIKYELAVLLADESSSATAEQRIKELREELGQRKKEGCTTRSAAKLNRTKAGNNSCTNVSNNEEEEMEEGLSSQGSESAESLASSTKSEPPAERTLIAPAKPRKGNSDVTHIDKERSKLHVRESSKQLLLAGVLPDDDEDDEDYVADSDAQISTKESPCTSSDTLSSKKSSAASVNTPRAASAKLSEPDKKRKRNKDDKNHRASKTNSQILTRKGSQMDVGNNTAKNNVRAKVCSPLPEKVNPQMEGEKMKGGSTYSAEPGPSTSGQTKRRHPSGEEGGRTDKSKRAKKSRSAAAEDDKGTDDQPTKKNKSGSTCRPM